MSVLTPTRDVLRVYRYGLNAKTRRQADASHIAMNKRFAAFTFLLGGFAVAVTAVISLKLAIYLPRVFH